MKAINSEVKVPNQSKSEPFGLNQVIFWNIFFLHAPRTDSRDKVVMCA